MKKSLHALKKSNAQSESLLTKKHIIKVAIDPNCYVAEQIAFQEHLIRNLLEQVQILTSAIDRLNVSMEKQLNQ